MLRVCSASQQSEKQRSFSGDYHSHLFNLGSVHGSDLKRDIVPHEFFSGLGYVAQLFKDKSAES